MIVFEKGDKVDYVGQKAVVVAGNQMRIGVVIKFSNGRTQHVQINMLKKI